MNRQIYGMLVAAGLATTGGALYLMRPHEHQVHAATIVELAEGYNEHCYTHASGPLVNWAITNQVPVWANDPSGLGWGTGATWTAYLIQTGTKPEAVTNVMASAFSGPLPLGVDYRMTIQTTTGKVIWAGWDSIEITNLWRYAGEWEPTGTYVRAEIGGWTDIYGVFRQFPMVTWYTNSNPLWRDAYGWCEAIVDAGDHWTLDLYTVTSSNHPSLWLPGIFGFYGALNGAFNTAANGGLTSDWLDYDNFANGPARGLGTINTNHLRDAQAIETRTVFPFIGYQADGGLLRELDARIRTLPPYYVDHVTSGVPVYATLTGTLAKAGFATNFLPIGYQVTTQWMQQAYAVLHTLTNTWSTAVGWTNNTGGIAETNLYLDANQYGETSWWEGLGDPLDMSDAHIKTHAAWWRGLKPDDPALNAPDKTGPFFTNSQASFCDTNSATTNTMITSGILAPEYAYEWVYHLHEYEYLMVQGTTPLGAQPYGYWVHKYADSTIYMLWYSYQHRLDRLAAPLLSMAPYAWPTTLTVNATFYGTVEQRLTPASSSYTETLHSLALDPVLFTVSTNHVDLVGTATNVARTIMSPQIVYRNTMASGGDYTPASPPSVPESYLRTGDTWTDSASGGDGTTHYYGVRYGVYGALMSWQFTRCTNAW